MATIKKLGFEGAIQIEVASGATSQVLATSGSLQGDSNQPTLVGVDMPPPPSGGGAGSGRAKFVYAEGTATVSGSVSFDCTEASMTMVGQLATGRGRRFLVRMAGGEVGKRLQNCYMTSLSLSGASGGLVSASLSFVSKSDWEDGAGFTPVKRDPSSGSYESPLAYWYSGGAADDDIKDWSLSVSQAATPMFGNIAGKQPLYIRIGAWEASLTVNTYLALKELEAVKIATKTVTITAGQQKSKVFTQAPSDVDTYSHTFEAMLDPAGGSSGDIITIA